MQPTRAARWVRSTVSVSILAVVPAGALAATPASGKHQRHISAPARAVRDAQQRYMLQNEVVRSRHFPDLHLKDFLENPEGFPDLRRPPPKNDRDPIAAPHAAQQQQVWIIRGGLSQTLLLVPDEFDRSYTCRPRRQSGQVAVSYAVRNKRSNTEEQRRAQRYQSLLDKYLRFMSAGLKDFWYGRYESAAANFLLAGALNQGDPASRLHAGQALFAIGKYTEALAQIRRAFELQPRIAILTFDLRRDYGEPREFDQQLEALAKTIRKDPSRTDDWILLAYMRYFTDRRDRARELLRKLKQYEPNHPVILALVGQDEPKGPLAVAGRASR